MAIRMRAHRLLASLILAGLAAGCGGSSPSAPSTLTPPTNVSPAATQGIVAAALSQATSAIVSASPDGLSRVITYNCPGGGSMTMTVNFTTPVGPAGTMTTSTRTEFNDCRSQTVTMNGDPYLMITGEHVFVRGGDGLTSGVTATIRMTGGLRFDVGGIQGRARYDCTQVMSVQIINGTPSQPSITSSGTITWEQPLGSVAVGPCGP
jgi:hypothetical protein